MFSTVSVHVLNSLPAYSFLSFPYKNNSEINYLFLLIVKNKMNLKNTRKSRGVCSGRECGAAFFRQDYKSSKKIDFST